MERRTGIGGFFGLELPEYGNFPQWHPGRSVAVNSGRRALEYILRRLGDVRCVRVTPVYMPDGGGNNGTAWHSRDYLPH